jgi:molybdopterin-guanine dinucleotide biosynthesis protein A
MGAAKALLDWHGRPLVVHVAAVMARAVAPGPVVVVARPGQELPPLGAGVAVVRDSVGGRGPLQGLLDGLEAFAGEVETAFVAGTDMPLLRPAFVRAVVLARTTDVDAAVPVAHGFRQPLAAAYAVALAPFVRKLLDDGERGAGVLLDRCRARFLDEAALLDDAELARDDPELDSLVNVNTPEEYAAALARGR